MLNIPSERDILQKIYTIYLDSYLRDVKKNSLNEIFVQINVEDVATALGMDKHLLFGYLRYLDRKYKKMSGPNTAEAHLFMPKVGQYRHAVDFPYLVAILAGHDQEHSKFTWTLWLSGAAIFISLVSLLAQWPRLSG